MCRSPQGLQHRRSDRSSKGGAGTPLTIELTLGRLAQEVGVVKPVAYNQFGTRSGLLVALYAVYNDRQNAVLTEALDHTSPALEANADAIATSYIDWVLPEGTEMPGVSGALTGSPELDALKRECQAAWMAICRDVLVPFGKAPIQPARRWAVVGAAERSRMPQRPANSPQTKHEAN